MKISKILKCGLAVTTICSSFGLATIARADNPLDYPPFKWYPLLPEPKAAQPAKASADKQNSGPQTNFSQGKDKSKQWYDGDFNGLDDD